MNSTKTLIFYCTYLKPAFSKEKSSELATGLSLRDGGANWAVL